MGEDGAKSRGEDGFRSKKLGRVAEKLLWTPKRLQWDPEASNELGWGLCFLYAATTGVTVANLYYCYPILHLLADDFGVTGERAALVPTLLQCGYACGLLFLIPIGDISRRRPLIIGLILVTSLLFLGLIITKDFTAFIVLSFLAAITGCTPQLMFPLTVQYSALRHRATMTSVLMSGLVFGIACARIMAGIISQYVAWRIVYWIAFGLQLGVGLLLVLFMPDYPVSRAGTSYAQCLWTMVQLPFQHPLLTQQSIIAFLIQSIFTCFWTTLTFELTDVFGFSALKIGLFSLIALAPVFLNPLVARLVTARLHPTGTLLIAHVISVIGVCIGTFVGNFSIGGLIVRAFLGDLGMNTVVVANRMAIANVHPKAQNAVNSVYMVFTFCGQMSGTAAGNKLYAQGGWIPTGILMIAFVGASLFLVIVRGPHEIGWVGWSGGWDLRDDAERQNNVEPEFAGERSGNSTDTCDEKGDR
ncbi:MFS general substrate transporter [Coniochaeta ligniaria NRRL 30616]|uniref:MFS general substrate transporter n=1 Tax=Coniochaeta ligniaria NRRL 30616 TaxID=1408157 RepID=A0A1J7J1Z3_9PEZI|nr:MFS general substrate transporter [Coniochaeta ligniaria NRRL 30616]